MCVTALLNYVTGLPFFFHEAAEPIPVGNSAAKPSDQPNAFLPVPRFALRGEPRRTRTGDPTWDGQLFLGQTAFPTCPSIRSSRPPGPSCPAIVRVEVLEEEADAGVDHLSTWNIQSKARHLGSKDSLGFGDSRGCRIAEE